MMKQKLWFWEVIFVGMLAALPGCALLSKTAPLDARYFSPDVETPPPGPQNQATGAPRLRLGQVQSGGHLRERMVYRSSDEEVGYYDDRRWTERPEAYLRRALSRSLFEVHGITRVVSGAAPTLDAELVAFEEIKSDQHKVRVQVVMRLDDATMGSTQRTITVERDVAGTDDEDPQPVVQALSRALADAVAQISDEVVDGLAKQPSLDHAPEPLSGTTTTYLRTTSSALATAPGK